MERFGVKRFQGSDKDFRFYTGLPTYSIFLCLFNFIAPLLSHLYIIRSDTKHDHTSTPRPYKPIPRALQPIDELFMALVRLRLALLEQDLSHRFMVSVSTVSRIRNTWIAFLDQQLRPLITWPSKAAINEHMPAQFKEHYPILAVSLTALKYFVKLQQILIFSHLHILITNIITHLKV